MIANILVFDYFQILWTWTWLLNYNKDGDILDIGRLQSHEIVVATCTNNDNKENNKTTTTKTSAITTTVTIRVYVVIDWFFILHLPHFSNI